MGAGFVSVIIPNYNSNLLLKQTIISLFSVNYPRNKYEVIVVDDCSDDRPYLEDIKIRYGESLKVIHLRENLGPANARNEGLKVINKKSEVILFVDAGTIADKKLLSYHYATHKQFVNIGAVTGKILYLGRVNLLSHIIEKGNMFPMSSSKEKILWASSNNLSVKSELVQKIKFDSFFPLAAGEDVDYTWRIRESGFDIFYCSKAIVYHERHNKLLTTLKRAIRYGRGQAYLVDKHRKKRVISFMTLSKIILLLLMVGSLIVGVFTSNIRLVIISPLLLALLSYFSFIRYLSHKSMDRERTHFVILLSIFNVVIMFSFYLGVFICHLKRKKIDLLFKDINPSYMVNLFGKNAFNVQFLNEMLALFISFLVITKIGG